MPIAIDEAYFFFHVCLHAFRILLYFFVGDTKKIVAFPKSQSKIVTKNEGTFFYFFSYNMCRNSFVLKIHM